MPVKPALMICCVVCLVSARAQAQTAPLTLADVLARARAQAPTVISARGVLEEVRGRLLGASLRFQTNPELDGGIGNRMRDGTVSREIDLGIGQSFEPRSRRAARIAVATEAIEAGAADVDDATRVVLRVAALAYYRAVYALERGRMLAAAQELSTGVFQAADRRFKSGDIAILDVNIARSSLARVRAEREAVAAIYAEASGELKQLLRIDGEITLQGDLRATPIGDVAALLQAAENRPELKRIEAGIREAEAEVRIASSFRKPDYSLGARYAREEQDTVWLGSLTVTLPIFSNGQELRAVASARLMRLRAELDRGRAQVRAEVVAAFEVYTRRLAAVRILESEALPGLDENENLTTRSFEVGQLGLPDLLLIRHEILGTRFQYVDALLEAALARVDLDAAAAVLR